MSIRLSKLRVKDIFGITEITLGDKDYEIVGNNKTGKTSIIEAIRLALNNRADKDVILRKGAEEGEILLETTNGILIRNKERTGKMPIRTVKEGKTPIIASEGFLRGLFSTMQLNPVEFIGLPKTEQNRIILDLIDFKWDITWIKEQFGEIVPDIDYNQNILKVLHDIQADTSHYFRTRQECNRLAKDRQACIADIAALLPENYVASDWERKNISELYTKIEQIRASNRQVEKAQTVINGQEGKMREFEANRQIALSALAQETGAARTRLEKEIERLKSEISKAQDDLSGLEQHRLDRVEKIDLEHKAAVAEFEAVIAQNKDAASKKLEDCSGLVEEAQHVEKMKGHIAEYKRMRSYQSETEDLNKQSEELTAKIEKARTLPAEILAQSQLPLKGLTIDVEQGIPLINGLPVSNLSEGEKLNLCVDIASLQKNSLKLVLIDGVEKLSEQNRKALYARCKERGLQFIATRTTEDDVLTVVEL